MSLLALVACDVATAEPTTRTVDRGIATVEFALSPTGQRVPIVHMGLAGSGAPPLGQGFLPSAGRPGDGAAQVLGIGGWSNGPGAVRTYGGQWVMPLYSLPGSGVANLSCDVKPSATATDTFELVGLNGVVGSFQVPATTAGVIVRGWIIPAMPYAVANGEQLLVRHSFRDAVTGAWTSAMQDMTVISCSMRAIALAGVRSTTLLPALSYNPGTWGPIDRWTDSNGRTMIATTSVNANGSGRINIPHDDGERLTGLTVFVSGDGASDAAFQVEAFNLTIAGGFTTLGPVTLDSNRGNVWAPLQVGVSSVALSANDVLFLDMAPTPGADVGYHVGGVIATFNGP